LGPGDEINQVKRVGAETVFKDTGRSKEFFPTTSKLWKSSEAVHSKKECASAYIFIGGGPCHGDVYTRKRF
jgi:hypothetical protein